MAKIDPGELRDGLSRRGLLQGVAGAAALSIAGCTDFAGGDGGDGGGVDPVDDRVTVDPADIVEGGTFQAAIGAAPDTFDYPYSSSAHTTLLMNLMYEAMITTGADGQIYPWLAESYERVDMQETSLTDYEDYMRTAQANDEGALDTDAQVVITHPDDAPIGPGEEGRVLTVEDAADAVADGTYGLQYQFDLHEGIEFHNGEELTADNVVQSYGRIEGSALSGQVFDTLLHVEADGDYTVNLYAQEPDAAFVREVGGLPIYPEETATLPPQKMDPRQGNTPLGTGPFVFEEYQVEEFVRYSTNDNYWFDTGMKDWFDGSDDFPNGPVVDGVDVQIITEDASRSAALQNDELDMTYGLTFDSLDSFRESEDFRTSATDGAGFEFMQYPVTNEPWDDDRIRRAVNHLIPREQIANNVYAGWESPAWVPMPPLAATNGTTDYEGLVEDLKSFNEYDPEGADELVQEVIDEKGIETPIEITMQTNSDNDDRVRVLELMSESINQSEHFDTNVETLEFLQLVGQLLSGEYHKEPRLAFIGLSGGFGPHGYAKSIHHPDNFGQCCNFQNIDNSELNEALREARYGTDVVEDADLRRERYDEIWELILEINANSYTTHSKTVGVVGSHVKGFNSYPSTQDLVGYGLYSPQDEQITYLDE